MKVLVFNPGFTSTKIGYFEDYEKLYSINLQHDENELRKFEKPIDQLEYRYQAILGQLEKDGIDVAGCDAYAGRGGSMPPCDGGTYFVNELMIDGFKTSPIRHPAFLGAQLAYELSKQYGGEAFTASSPDTDELSDLARVTGLKGVYRESHGHALNQKEVAHRFAASIGKRYDEVDVIVCHLGGGTSVGAHKHGKIVDAMDNMRGEGAMCSSRCGGLTVRDVMELCFSGKYSKEEILSFTDRTGGWRNHLDTVEAKEVVKRIQNGDKYAKLIYDATIYQHAKQIAGFMATLEGHADAIIVTGGIANDKYFISRLETYVGKLAPFVVMPGEFELEALAASVIRHYSGEEPAKPFMLA